MFSLLENSGALNLLKQYHATLLDIVGALMMAFGPRNPLGYQSGALGENISHLMTLSVGLRHVL